MAQGWEMAERACAEIAIETSEELARIIRGALLPESERPSSPRSRASVDVRGGRLTIAITATDVAALRAAANSYLHWVDGIVGVFSGVRRGGRDDNYKHGCGV